MYDYPDKSGHFGPYGGIYVAETMMGVLDELNQAYITSDAPARFITPNICPSISAAHKST